MATDLLDPTIDGEISTLDPFEIPKGYELIGGELVEKPEMGAPSSAIASDIHGYLFTHLLTHPIGKSYTAEFSYRCFPHRPDTVRKPDASVVLCDPKLFRILNADCEVVPSLIVEVSSPSNSFTELTGKARLFLAAGTRLAWIIDPLERYALILRSDGTGSHIDDAGVLSGEDVLPGFTLPLADVLPPL